jgi:hypothetical protein
MTAFSIDKTFGWGRRMDEGVNRLLLVAAQRGLGMPQFDPKQSFTEVEEIGAN